MSSAKIARRRKKNLPSLHRPKLLHVAKKTAKSGARSVGYNAGGHCLLPTAHRTNTSTSMTRALNGTRSCGTPHWHSKQMPANIRSSDVMLPEKNISIN